MAAILVIVGICFATVGMGCVWYAVDYIPSINPIRWTLREAIAFLGGLLGIVLILMGLYLFLISGIV